MQYNSGGGNGDWEREWLKFMAGEGPRPGAHPNREHPYNQDQNSYIELIKRN